ncbi:MAG: CDP-diacylglycerol--glycerol-3-phosphate 3-phosphatidyltransferase [Coxiellaceae bacterium]|nr:MAG: CDP-diacylglycerol--glycerol-3-phosphate 3-phosphatidyltransferase [Coxiellaceae bacterium]
MNIPTALTFIRILTIPVFVVLFYLPGWGRTAAAIIFAVAALTDWLDGYLARNLSQTTRFGAFLDPVADKLQVAIALVLVVGSDSVPYLTIPAAIIVGREIVISALREWMAEIGKRTSVAVSMIGKLKTVMQMVALVLLLAFSRETALWWWVLGAILLYIAAVLTLWSMVMYLKAAWPDLTLSEDK